APDLGHDVEHGGAGATDEMAAEEGGPVARRTQDRAEDRQAIPSQARAHRRVAQAHHRDGEGAGEDEPGELRGPSRAQQQGVARGAAGDERAHRAESLQEEEGREPTLAGANRYRVLKELTPPHEAAESSCSGGPFRRGIWSGRPPMIRKTPSEASGRAGRSGRGRGTFASRTPAAGAGRPAAPAYSTWLVLSGSASAMRAESSFLSLSLARISSCRARSRLKPKCSPSSLRVMGRSFMTRCSMMKRSRGSRRSRAVRTRELMSP